MTKMTKRKKLTPEQAAARLAAAMNEIEAAGYILLAQIERNIRELEAQLPIEEQLRLKLRRFIYANIPELAGKIDITWRY